MATAFIDVTPELLAKVLHFPEGTKILATWTDVATGTVRMLVEHDEIPAASPIPCAMPSFCRRNSGDTSEVVFVSWGVPLPDLGKAP